MSNNRSIQFVGADPQSCTPCSILFCDTSERILINCGESFQRLCIAQKINISKITDIIIQYVDSYTLAGLPGFLLTVENILNSTFPAKSKEKMQKFGAVYSSKVWHQENNYSYYRYYRNLMYKAINYTYNDHINSEETTDKQLYDEFIEMSNYIRYIRIIGPSGIFSFINEYSKHISKFINLAIEVIELNETLILPLHPLSQRKSIITLFISCEKYKAVTKNGNNLKKLSTATKINNIEYIYLQAPSIPGKLHIDKAKELNVPIGPLLARLKSGESITLDNGEVIYPMQVCESTKQGSAILIMMEALIESSYINCLPKEINIEEVTAVILTKNYLEPVKQIIKPFISNHKIIRAFADNDYFTNNFYIYQNCLNLFLSKYLPDLYICNVPTPVNYNFYSNKIMLMSSETIIKQFDYDVYKDSLDFIAVFKENFDKYIEENEELKKSLNEIKGCNNKNTSNKLTNSIVLLGTGAAIPCAYRNVSCTIIFTDLCNILLDCGEGTLNQIAKLYNVKNDFIECILTIRLIFISHKHGDHINGLIHFLNYRYQLLKSNNLTDIDKYNLYLLVPRVVSSWIDTIADKTVKILYNDDYAGHSQYLPSFKISVETSFVDHIGYSITPQKCSSFGIKIVLNNNKTIAYSGDTAYCPTFANLCTNCDYLIHEATFEDDCVDLANNRKHSTISSAIKLGIEANCKLIILTHFSQRHPLIPKLLEYYNNIIYGIDYTVIDLEQTLDKLYFKKILLSKLLINNLNKVIKDQDKNFQINE